MHHEILIQVIRKKITDEKVIWLVKTILLNFKNKELGMPLGNLTSQFFANVFLNELDYFVKHQLKARFYIRYVDDFVILHDNRHTLEYYKCRIVSFLKTLKIELHQDKTKIFPLHKGVSFLGYRIFYHHKLLRKSNLKAFEKKFGTQLVLFNEGLIDQTELESSLAGWFGYAMWASTYKLRSRILDEIERD